MSVFDPVPSTPLMLRTGEPVLGEGQLAGGHQGSFGCQQGADIAGGGIVVLEGPQDSPRVQHRRHRSRSSGRSHRTSASPIGATAAVLGSGPSGFDDYAVGVDDADVDAGSKGGADGAAR